MIVIGRRHHPELTLALLTAITLRVDAREWDSGQLLHVFLWITDGCRCRNEFRIRPVSLTQLSQPVKDVRHVRSKNAAILMTFVDHDQFQVSEESLPLSFVMLKHRKVQHVRIGQHQLNLFPDGRADRTISRAVIAAYEVFLAGLKIRNARNRCCHLPQFQQLVICQCLLRIQEQHRCIWVFTNRMKRGQRIDQRLSAGSSRGDYGVVAGKDTFDRIMLMRIQTVRELS